MDSNVELGKSPQWKDCGCVRCGRTPSETVLNIEAVIHHGVLQLLCVDLKDCAKKAKKRKKK